MELDVWLMKILNIPSFSYRVKGFHSRRECCILPSLWRPEAFNPKFARRDEASSGALFSGLPKRAPTR
ncbi:MAG: hypothetical protein JJ937_14600 [Parvibaculum sp.]|uniref:hypothetical protein n=1 Tax=Parvibaculum sp. TaxID=2024848 RepID=UPI001B115E3D|nr:hypothetical protein [Parvibaculum sp.]MBO6635758.1 hypothetical protein [Parvibaculum sp.]